MTHKERIVGLLRSEPVDRIGILDQDIELYSQGAARESEKFFALGLNGPFQAMSSELGLEQALIRFAQEPRHCMEFFKDYLAKIVQEHKILRDDGFRFDAVWIWEDIAYDKGLYFSTKKYAEHLSRPHRDIVEFFASQGLPAFFHCDGRVEELIPFLVRMQVAAMHPVQERANPNLIEIKRDLKGQMSFVGGVDLDRIRRSVDELTEHVERLKEDGNYIFSFDGPIPEDIDKRDYDNIIREIERTGVYS